MNTADIFSEFAKPLCIGLYLFSLPVKSWTLLASRTSRGEELIAQTGLAQAIHFYMLWI